MTGREDQTEEGGSSLWSQLAEWASSTSLHAVKYLFQATKIRRIIWIIITIAVSAAFMVQFVLSLKMFFRYDTITTFDHEEKQELIMPSITICNLNLFKRSLVAERDPAMVETFEQVMEIAYGLRDNTTLTRPESMKQYKFLEFYTNTAHRQKEFFLWCSIGQRLINCSDYITAVATNAGLCYTFNSKESIRRNGILTMKESGPYDGINIVLDTEPNDYLVENGFGVGIRFVIHEPDTPPLVNSGSYFAGPGQETFFSLTETHSTHLKPPYSKTNCVAEDELVQKGEELNLGGPYTPEACSTACYFTSVYDCPHCSISGDNGKPTCTVYDSIQCGVNNGVTNQRDRLCDCPPKCQSTSFSATNMHTNIASPFILRMAQMSNWTARNESEIQRRLILLRVYFDTNMVTKVTQKAAILLIETLADVGGTLGLYLGASFVTLLEFADFLAMYISDRVKSYKLQKKKDHSTKTPADKYRVGTIITSHIGENTEFKLEQNPNRYSTAEDYNNFDNHLYDTYDNIHQ